MDEMLEVVDLKNNVIGLEKRMAVHENGLYHRAVNVVVLNSAGLLYLQQRSARKLVAPLKWEFGADEHVEPGETYQEAGIRGLREELGITEQLKLSPIGGVYLNKNIYGKLKEYEFFQLYKVVYDGPIKLDEVEVADGRFFTVQEVSKLIEGKEMCPWVGAQWKYLKEYGVV